MLKDIYFDQLANDYLFDLEQIATNMDSEATYDALICLGQDLAQVYNQEDQDVTKSSRS